MNENIIYANAELQLDTSAIKDRSGFAASSLTDINQIPVFSDSFEERVQEKGARENVWEETLTSQVFDGVTIDTVQEDVRSRMFLQTNTEEIIRNDTAGKNVSSFLQISGGVIAAGILLAGMMWVYGRKGKRKSDVDNQYETYFGTTEY